MRSHFITFPWGIEVILGMNGYIWVGKPRKSIAELDLDAVYSSELSEVSRIEREQIIRTCCAIRCLDQIFRNIDNDSIIDMFNRIKNIPLSKLGEFDPLK
jgi:exosome complex component RRP4